MGKTPRGSAQKPLVSAVWGSRFVDLNSQRRNDEPARHFFDSFFARSCAAFLDFFWLLLWLWWLMSSALILPHLTRWASDDFALSTFLGGMPCRACNWKQSRPCPGTDPRPDPREPARQATTVARHYPSRTESTHRIST